MNKKVRNLALALVLIAAAGVWLTLPKKEDSGKLAKEESTSSEMYSRESPGEEDAALEKTWKLVWADEFDLPDGSGVDETKWVHDIGGDGWGNNEKQYYTGESANCYIEDGHLIIEARKEEKEGNSYTSARITTKSKYEFCYGKVEIKAKIPYGEGIWPAFWMLGADFDTAGWPDCGEIDIMENVGKEPQVVHGTLHGPGYSGNMAIGNVYKIDENFSDDFHVFSIQWQEDSIEWFVDGELYHTMDTTRTIGNDWVYNKKFFMLLNLAVGGNWPGDPDETTIFPQKYVIDYVRVYQ